MGNDDWRLYSGPLDDLPRSPSGRVPRWVSTARATRGMRAPAPAAGDFRRARSRVTPLLAAVLVVLLTLVAAASSITGKPIWLITGPLDGDFGEYPSPGREAAKAPLGAPAALTRWSDSFAFLRMQADGKTPVAYDPCRPVHYVVNPQNAPLGGAEMVQSAVGRISSATGLHFKYDGPTPERPTTGRKPYQPERYGDRWAPVLIAWSTPNERTDLAGAVAGVGGSTAIQTGSLPSVYTTGVITLDGPQIQEVLGRPQGADQAQAIIAHELGHLVGLDHIQDRSQLMFPQALPWVSLLGAGDFTGLAALGRGACVPGY